jgi:serine/threonine-protein kinase
MNEEARPDATQSPPPQPSVAVPPAKRVIPPAAGEVITSLATGNTFTMGAMIGEGHFGVVYECTDIWNNDLAAKVLKPIGTYDSVKASAEAELAKLRMLRHPFVTYVFDAFEYRDTFYIITERCHGPLGNLFRMRDFQGNLWLMPIARCLLQALYYLHINNYVHQDIHSGNVFSAIIKDEMTPTERDAMVFKLGDLGVAKLLNELDARNTRAEWMLPPEVLKPDEFGPIDHRVDIYHTGLLFLELAYSKVLRFAQEEILGGKPRDLALQLPSPLNFALEKSLRRHVQFRTADAMEFWRDLHAAPQSQK